MFCWGLITIGFEKINSFHFQEQRQSDGGRGRLTGEILTPAFAWVQTHKLRLVYLKEQVGGSFWSSKSVYPLISFLHSQQLWITHKTKYTALGLGHISLSLTLMAVIN